MKSNRAAYQREWRRKNPGSNKASQRKYYLKNKAKMDAYQREWAKTHRAKLAAQMRQRRAKMRIENPNRGKEFYAKNKESILKKRSALRASNLEKYRALRRRDYHKHKAKRAQTSRLYRLRNPQKISSNLKTWRSKNREHIKNYVDNRYATNPTVRLKAKTSAAMSKVLKRFKARKSNKTLALLGCGLQQFKAHIESQFSEGMSWANRSEWHIDHIRPCASFDLSDPEQQKQCFHFSNLKPEWATNNLKKSSWWNGKLHRPSKRALSA